MSDIKKRLFGLGQTVATLGALELLERHGVTYWHLLDRHSTGDWGDDLPAEDVKANEDAVKYGDRLLSAYTVGCERVWIITESDRSVTTLLLPEEY
jgi:hypothetical protein